MKKSNLLNKVLLSSFLSSIPLFGMGDLNGFLQDAYTKNQELKSLESSLEVAKQQISVAANLNNPVLSFGATDIWLSDFSKRDVEPMQAYFVGITQSFPLTKKLETKKQISRNDFQIQKYKLEDIKLKFKSNIALYLFNIAIIEQKLLLFTKLENNLSKLEKFLKELYKFNKVKQNQILKTQILKDEIKAKKIDLYRTLKVQTKNLERITYTKYENIPLSLKLKDIKLKANSSNHPTLLNLQEQIKKYENISTPMLEEVMAAMPEFRADIGKEVKLGRFGRPEEIAASALFLASDDASYVTGQSLIVDGGYTAGHSHGIVELMGLV